MLVEILVALLAVAGSLYFYLTRNFNYWKKKGIVYIEPKFPFGTVQDQFLGKGDAGTAGQKIYNEYKKGRGLKYVGGFMLQQPSLLVFDLDLCKQILTKDFHHFVARDLGPTTHEFISKHLFALEGQEWKDMRTKLTPTFTSGKIKNMFLLMGKCADQLQAHIDKVVLQKGEFEVKDLIARFTTDIIATCAFGLEVNSIEDRDDEFFKVGQLIFVPNRSIILKILLFRNFPITAKLLNINFFHPKISTVLKSVMKETVKYRKEKNVTRNDFVDLLLKVKENKSLEDDDAKHSTEQIGGCKLTNFLKTGKQDIAGQDKDQLTLEEMTAQAFVFFAAGFETAASTTSFCLYELAKNLSVQETLRREIDEVMANHDNMITYQGLQDMTYMDQVVNETLRMYASLPFLTRVCTEKYQVPGTDLIIDEGVRINIPTYSIHHDPDIYPDPYTFDPDRFSEENSKGRHQYAFIPFGEGPRICIGMRFGRLQVKIGLAAILSRYQLSPAPDTPSKLEINPFIVFTTAKHPYRLRIAKRTDV
uniref:Cytochrome P450 n=1 Tax=Graphocephala atropunctata TaxID=36148 RepID=A0A1B6M6B5_9HEMI